MTGAIIQHDKKSKNSHTGSGGSTEQGLLIPSGAGDRKRHRESDDSTHVFTCPSNKQML